MKNARVDDTLVDEFETQRPRLTAIAHRILGSPVEAEDAVQETWLRLERSDAASIENPGAWLTTVVSRVSLDMLRSRGVRGEISADSLADRGVEPIAATDIEADAVLADSISQALLVVLSTLSPTERVAFVLHDAFAVPFSEIGLVLGRSPNAAKQLASRARQKVHGSAPSPEFDVAEQRKVVDAFLAAAREGALDRLVSLLAPDVALDADAIAVSMGSPAALRGSDQVAGMFSGRALGAEVAVLDGAAGLLWQVGGQPKVAWEFTVQDGLVTHIDMVADPTTLVSLEPASLN